MPIWRSLIAAVLIAAGMHAGGTSVWAQTYPSRAITIINASAPGGISDTGTRLFADALSRSMGVPVVVDNRPGAGGAIAARAVIAARPDGYTLLASQNTLHETLPAAGAFPLDGVSDFTFLTPLFRSDSFVVTRPDLKLNSLQELVALAKTEPGGLTFGDVAPGAPPQIMVSIIKVRTGANFVMVPYRASTQLMTDLLGGRLDFAAPTYAIFGGAADKVNVLAVASEARSPKLPNVPTFAEAGFGDVFFVWWGIVGPAGLPTPVVDKLYAEFLKASRDPQIIAKLDALNIQVKTLAPHDFRTRTIANQKILSVVIKEAGLKIE
jgi:tripartite-type tricarboxylate transporter receptor subunit TctC